MSTQDNLDRIITQAFESEHMPEGLKSSTLTFIHAKAQEPQDTQNEAASQIKVAENTPSTSPELKLVKNNRTKRVPLRVRIPQMIAACLAICMLAFAGISFAAETAQIEFSGSASLNLGLNRWGNVVRVECADPELKDMVNDLGLLGLSYSDALDRLSSQSELQNTLAAENTLVIMCSASTQEQQDAVLAECEQASVNFEVSTTCMGQGMGLGMGQGKGQGQGQGKGEGPKYGRGAGNKG
ncbi:MAG: hypothetical protein IKE43_01890 [Coriobacteriales bacterium]|nr:hypothetical protein [Coriobacteriales bacterium]